MSRRFCSLLTIVCTALLLVSSCKKDELTVVSTAPPAHVCSKIVINLNMDSLIHLDPPLPGGSDLEVVKCECDTVAFYPMNIPQNAEFEGWVIDQGEENAHQEALDLDTITMDSELWMHFEHVGPNDGVVRIVVENEPCK